MLAAWSAARGGPLPVAVARATHEEDGHDADDDDDRDGDVPARSTRSACASACGTWSGSRRAVVAGPGLGHGESAGYPLTLGVSGARPQRSRGHVDDAPRTRQEARRGGTSSSRRGPCHRLSAYRYAARWCSTIMRYGRAAVLAPCTWVTRPAGSYADPPPDAPQAPAQVDVLQVHEVPLVPAADRVERARAGTRARARHPVDVAGLVPVGVELAVAAGEPVARHDATEHRVADRVDGRRRAARADGYCEPSGFSSAGPTAARSGSAVERGRARGGGARRRPRGRGCTTATTGAGVAAMPEVGGGGVPEVAAGLDDGDVGERARAASPTEPSREPLSTTTTSGGPGAVVGEQRAHAVEQQRPRLEVDDDRGPARRRRRSRRQSTKRYLTRRPERDEAVAPGDLLALVELAAGVRDRHLVDADALAQDLGRDLGLEVEAVARGA